MNNRGTPIKPVRGEPVEPRAEMSPSSSLRTGFDRLRANGEGNQLSLNAKNLQVSIGGHDVCRNFNFVVESGTRWAVLGINGAGKTTLLTTLAGLRKPAAGEVLLEGDILATMSPRQRARQLGLMVQDDHDDPEISVLDVALLGRLPHLAWWEAESIDDEKIATDALTAVGLSGLATRRAATLSGGERRRLALASLIAQQSPLLLLDEPTSHLDLHQQIALLDLLVALPQRTLVMSLHDVNLAARYCTHVLMLFGDGETRSGTVQEMLTPQLLTQLYRHPVDVVQTPQGAFYFPG
jgi:iron complex transport system ATP-binding protein